MERIDSVVDQYNTSLTTEGDFKTEDESKAAFIEAFESCPYFRVYEEVDCWYFGGSVWADKPTGRIDYLLTPSKKLLDAGWKNGIIGVEVKKSGHKVGPLICQMIDYSKAIYRLPGAAGNVLVCASSVCAWPPFSKGGTIQSILSNNRLGVVCIDAKGYGISVNGSWAFRNHIERGLHFVTLACGYKNGSR